MPAGRYPGRTHPYRDNQFIPDDVFNDGISDVTSVVRGKSQRRLHRTLT